jgi:hypothetical protein
MEFLAFVGNLEMLLVIVGDRDVFMCMYVIARDK